MNMHDTSELERRNMHVYTARSRSRFHMKPELDSKSERENIHALTSKGLNGH
jgi:hypothetical protein